MQPPEQHNQRPIPDDSPGVSYWTPSGVVTSMWVSLAIALGTLGLFGFGLVYTLIGATPAEGELQFNGWVVALLSVAILVVHQLVHAGISRIYGGRPRIEPDVVQWVFPVMYVRSTGQYFSRSAFLVFALGPLVALSLTGCLMMVLDHRAVMLIIPLAINTSMSTRDLWMAWVVWKLPRESMVQVQRDGLTLISSDPEYEL